ncbi:NACHT, LRR and PYD domains-containing protein 1b allele 3-like [Dicentrarchus labrax]|uniref:NACHT, LRR and PYD domains-containing protein 1b allele 3-like n=1 Tax=Dicentrarchus labrax TaxID=13489 RepID=UPI0021F53929|nr:NACHT, LRR and PYD domains-containing protein 1b allele 3-like [Dicentrarchus labrax]
MELHATADPTAIQLSPKDGVCLESASPENSSSSDEMFGDIDPNSIFQLPVRKDTDDGGPSFYSSSTVNIEESGAQDAFKLLSVQSESDTGDVSDAHVEMDAPFTAENYSATNTLPTRSFEEFTPDITADENDESYRFQCSCPGLYQCSVTGLLFHMDGEGDVVYRIVPWDRRLLGQHHKQPAGPLFDIKCVQQSMCQLHLPHCEIRSTGGCGFLSVAHVNDDSIEFIVPHKITETHVIINITGFSGFGNVKDEDSPPDLVRALVLLFYRPPADPDLESLLNVLLLPTNVVLRDVLRIRKKLVGDENYIETSPHCKLHPKQEYKLSTCPEDDSVLVQPTEAEFDCDNYDNYFPSFQVTLEKIMKHIKLFLRETKSPHSVWERRVCLSPSAVKRCVQGSSDERLLDIRSSFIDGISGPVLKSLLDKLFEKTVLTDSERESADEIQNKSDKARFVIDTVRKKGEAAGSEMIDFLCEVDPFLSEHLGLI